MSQNKFWEKHSENHIKLKIKFLIIKYRTAKLNHKSEFINILITVSTISSLHINIQCTYMYIYIIK